jgi:hypothetical protein
VRIEGSTATPSPSMGEGGGEGEPLARRAAANLSLALLYAALAFSPFASAHESASFHKLK